MYSIPHLLGRVALIGTVLGVVIFSFPALFAFTIQQEQKPSPLPPEQFPISVDPRNKIIVENELADAFFERFRSPFQAAVLNTRYSLGTMLAWIAASISEAPWYRGIAAVDGRFVTITPGMRKEQVAEAFAKTLAWNTSQKKEFVTPSAYSELPFPEGSFLPGVYFTTSSTTPIAAQELVNERFRKEILARYGTIADIVPLDQALTIASLIEREAGGMDDMRFISGIIWNRLFINMNLQIDATIQYVKANATATGSWWPKVVPKDMSRRSLYNTYANAGLPPTPIANPSVAAVLAALNPRKTSCLFYFHDSRGGFHCTDTYEQHVALLKKYYGRGK